VVSNMEKWEIALNKFLENWRTNPEVVGCLVCGSFITGNPSNHSDIDIHLILSDEIEWRERGNKIIDGLLIEYFANPPKQIIKYFESDKAKNSTMSLVQFLTGRILFEKDNIISELKSKAKEYFDADFKEMNPTVIELTKYSLWDMEDNLRDLYESNAQDFVFSYHNALKELFEKYLKFLKLPVGHYYKYLAYLNSETSRKKYLLDEFTDNEFGKIYMMALVTEEKTKMMEYYTRLTEHILKKMGGFNVNGWKMKSNIE
jgi:hypothetical protein